MKTIILAGGYGTRLAEYTIEVPKPLVQVGEKPILLHIMQHYSFFGHKDFVVALGYKGEKIKEYFVNFNNLNSDLRINLSSGEIEVLNANHSNLVISLIDTGLGSMTGGRIKRLEGFIDDDCFFMTYGDGLSSVDINKLKEFHFSHGKLVTMTAVRPSARFGELEIDGNLITDFEEKPSLKQGWINCGFFVMNKKVFDYISDDQTVFEREPLQNLAKDGELMAYKHEGFWQCMDTIKDKALLEKHLETKAPWQLNR